MTVQRHTSQVFDIDWARYRRGHGWVCVLPLSRQPSPFNRADLDAWSDAIDRGFRWGVCLRATWPVADRVPRGLHVGYSVHAFATTRAEARAARDQLLVEWSLS
jgi:hypothetical protein